MRVIAIVSGRGGTGKTTTALAVGAALAARSVRVAIVDADPQASATIWSPAVVLNGARSPIYRGGHIVLTRHEPVPDPMWTAPVELTHRLLPPGGLLLHRGGRPLVSATAGELESYFRRTGIDRDLVLIDCEPAIHVITPAAVRAADLVLVPMQPMPGSLPGLGDVLQLVESERPEARVRVALTAAPNRTLTRVIATRIAAQCPDLLYRAVVPVDVQAAKAVAAFLPVTLWRPNSKAALAYSALANEIADDLRLPLSGAPAPSEAVHG